MTRTYLSVCCTVQYISMKVKVTLTCVQRACSLHHMKKARTCAPVLQQMTAAILQLDKEDIVAWFQSIFLY